MDNVFMSFLALGPLAVYLVMIGWLHLSSKIHVVPGERDAAALALALMGMVAVGPGELFFPSTAMIRFGWGVWLALAMLYGLAILLIVLNLRPQWVIYGAGGEQTLQALLTAAQRQDPGAVQQHEFVDLPQIGLRLRVEDTTGDASCRITAVSQHVSVRSWRRLQSDLADELNQQPKYARRIGWFFMVIGGAMILMMARTVVKDPQAIASGIEQWLNH